MDDKLSPQAKKVVTDRLALLNRYQEANNREPVALESETAPEEAKASLDNASNESKSDAHPEEGKPAGDAEKSPVGQGDKPAPDAKETEPDTMVSVKALHAEREKRKEKTLEARRLADEVAQRDKVLAEERSKREALEARLKALEQKLVDPKAPKPSPQDEVARQLAEENKRLKAEADAKAQEAAKLAQEKAQADADAKIEASHKKLAAEGFPGFKEFVRDTYDAVIAKINSGELDPKDITPDVWENVYRTEVYPAKLKIFEAKVKAEKDAKKVQQKKNANLVGNPGLAPEPKDEANLDAPQTAESYMKFRKTIR